MATLILQRTKLGGMAYEKFGNYVDEVGGECDRWTQAMETIFEVNGRFFAVGWSRGLTELQEDEFWMADVYEVEKKERVIFEWVRKE